MSNDAITLELLNTLIIEFSSVDATHYDFFLKGLGKPIRQIRKDKGLSMEALAYKIEIEYRQLGRIERGEGNVTIFSLLRIAEALQVDIRKFFAFNA